MKLLDLVNKANCGTRICLKWDLNYEVLEEGTVKWSDCLYLIKEEKLENRTVNSFNVKNEVLFIYIK